MKFLDILILTIFPLFVVSMPVTGEQVASDDKPGPSGDGNSGSGSGSGTGGSGDTTSKSSPQDEGGSAKPLEGEGPGDAAGAALSGAAAAIGAAIPQKGKTFSQCADGDNKCLCSMAGS